MTERPKEGVKNLSTNLFSVRDDSDPKIELCRRHWQQLSPHVKDRPTAKHLIACVDVAERLTRENNKLEMELRQWRSMQDADLSELLWHIIEILGHRSITEAEHVALAAEHLKCWLMNAGEMPNEKGQP